MSALQIIRETALAYGITVAELKSKSRASKLINARIDAAQRIRIERGLTSGEMAKFFNRSAWTCRYYFNTQARTRHRTRKRDMWRKKYGLQ
jgi:cytidylate kinase